MGILFDVSDSDTRGMVFDRSQRREWLSDDFGHRRGFSFSTLFYFVLSVLAYMAFLEKGLLVMQTWVIIVE